MAMTAWRLAPALHSSSAMAAERTSRWVTSPGRSSTVLHHTGALPGLQGARGDGSRELKQWVVDQAVKLTLSIGFPL